MRPRVARWIAVGSSLAALVAGAALAAPGASALITNAGSARVSYKPLRADSSESAPAAVQKEQGASVRPLEYHGGPVMPSNMNYAIYWAPSGAAAYPSGYSSGIDRYFEDLAHDSGGIQNTDSILAQYGDSTGHFALYSSQFGGPLFDTHAYPANGCSQAPVCFTDAQLRTELTRYVGELHLPTDLQHEYFLLVPPGVESCLEAAGHSCSAGSKKPVYCAYHGFITTGAGPLVYANTPYMNGTNCDTGEEHPNGNPSDATLGGGLVHEHSESVTDPELTAWFDSKEEEVADKCRTHKATEFGEPLGKASNGSNYNEVIDGDLYWYQQMWSNQAGGCQQRVAAPPPTIKKVKPKSGPAGGGTSITVTGTGFVGSVTVLFGSTPATEVTVVSSTTITAVSPPGAVGTVDVRVQSSAGTSLIVKG
ncbi:MAG TPA: IPT/TIG domain-containing protein, partial [Solirubrobacteraceae bacterium]|nr:IPT/TIG domain-containing protein [Solirubrobacteraceae bacterium]